MTVLAHIADIHFGGEDEAAVAAFEAALKRLPDPTVVVAGDLTLKGKRSEFRAAARWLASLKRPILIAAGNHDVPLFDIGQRVFNPFGAYRNAFADHAAAQSLQAGSFSLLSINTARAIQWRLNWAHGAISEDQARSAVRELAGAPAETVRTLVCHHPLVLPPGAPIKTKTRGGPEAASILAEGGVDIVLTGHLHRPFVLQLPQGDGKTWSVGCGTLSHRTRGDPASFTVLARDDGGVRVTAWRIEPGAAASPAETAVLPLRRRLAPNQSIR